MNDDNDVDMNEDEDVDMMNKNENQEEWWIVLKSESDNEKWI